MARALKVAVQMDPIQSIDIDADSTFALMLEAQERGHTLWHYHPRDLSFAAGRVVARAQPVEVERKRGAHWRFRDEEELDLSTRSEEHTSELQSRQYLVCRLLLEKKTINLH